ncbi:hypothetical protein [Streptomyces sp. NPDC054826]
MPSPVMYECTEPGSSPSASRSASRKVCGYACPSKGMPLCSRTVLWAPSQPAT